jgi:hypothetical protein
MKGHIRIVLAVAVLSLAAMACQAVTGGGNTDVPNVPTVEVEVPKIEIPTIEVPDILNNDIMLSDDFSSEQWGTGTDADSSVEYSNESLQFIVSKDLYFVWSTPNDEDYENIHVEVTATNNSTDSTGAFGIICNLNSVTDTSYYFAVTGAGEYAIGRYTLTDDTLLTNDGTWGASDAITSGAASYRIGADCGNGTLTLYVDGQQVDSVNDDYYTSGSVGLFAWSGEQTDGTDVFFDDLELKKLP